MLPRNNKIQEILNLLNVRNTTNCYPPLEILKIAADRIRRLL